MSKIIISSQILGEPINMMSVVLREVETLAIEKGLDPKPIKESILSAPTIPDIEDILFKYFEGEIILRY
jgi:hypothetical protein